MEIQSQQKQHLSWAVGFLGIPEKSQVCRSCYHTYSLCHHTYSLCHHKNSSCYHRYSSCYHIYSSYYVTKPGVGHTHAMDLATPLCWVDIQSGSPAGLANVPRIVTPLSRRDVPVLVLNITLVSPSLEKGRRVLHHSSLGDGTLPLDRREGLYNKLALLNVRSIQASGA